MSLGNTADINKDSSDTGIPASRKLSLDWWSVIVALIVSMLIGLGVLPHVPW